MANSHLKNNEMFFDAIMAAAKKAPKTHKDKGFGEFVDQLYKFAPSGDLKAYGPEDLCAMAESLFDFISERSKDTPKVRIYNPEKKKNGWDSEYTVIEIVNDDMPFLVDSITEEIKRHGLKIFGLLHPVSIVKRDTKGALQDISSAEKANDASNAESVIHMQVSYIGDAKKRSELEKD